MTDKPTTTWRKSSCSATDDQCVEILGTLDAARDSKHPSPELRFGTPDCLRLLFTLLRDRNA